MLVRSLTYQCMLSLQQDIQQALEESTCNEPSPVVLATDQSPVDKWFLSHITGGVAHAKQ